MDTAVIAMLGTVLDNRGQGQKRWERWRPTLSLCQQRTLRIDRLDLLFQPTFQNLADQLTGDIATVSPDTRVVHHRIDFDDPWDFESVYATLHDFSRRYESDPESEELLIHITTGTHVAQICLYLLTEARHLNGKLIQTAPPDRSDPGPGRFQIIDLDLAKYEQIASRFMREHLEGTDYLKDGIATRNAPFNRLIEQLERVSIRSREPILLIGPTGAGKSQLAARIYALKKQRDQVSGPLVQVNCATLRGDNAMSTLFGHIKGAFTGAVQNRAGLLLQADKGLLFLDEIGELGRDEQAMLLRVIEEKSFLPMGADRESRSDFQLIAGTNRDLLQDVERGRFREDLLARIDLWRYRLPPLKERMEDFEPNLDYEIERYAAKTGIRVRFNVAARSRYLNYAKSSEALWKANFRDLNASVTRMATLAPGGWICEEVVLEEIERLQENWRSPGDENSLDDLESLLGAAKCAELDRFDRIQLSEVIGVCRKSRSAAEAGRKLFDRSRNRKTSVNDSHRLRQYLAKFDLTFETLRNDRAE
ncbi:MAG: RNA repair transcriptional activator RtcR [Gammaproteobacteria bacterium]